MPADHLRRLAERAVARGVRSRLGGAPAIRTADVWARAVAPPGPVPIVPAPGGNAQGTDAGRGRDAGESPVSPPARDAGQEATPTAERGEGVAVRRALPAHTEERRADTAPPRLTGEDKLALPRQAVGSSLERRAPTVPPTARRDDVAAAVPSRVDRSEPALSPPTASAGPSPPKVPHVTEAPAPRRPGAPVIQVFELPTRADRPTGALGAPTPVTPAPARLSAPARPSAAVSAGASIRPASEPLPPRRSVQVRIGRIEVLPSPPPAPPARPGVIVRTSEPAGPFDALAAERSWMARGDR
jgi:hypothetical protein